MFDQLKDACPLKPEKVEGGLDIMVVRELTGGIYFGERGYIDENTAYDTEKYSVFEIERIAKVAFDLAMKRNRKVTSIDKSNVLETSRLWRKTVERIAKDYPEVELDHYYVDNAAMQLMKSPKQFDVILTGNMFRDIYEENGYEGRLLGRTTEDAVTVTSPLIPWNTCGMTQATILNVPTMTYLPYCFFNYISPLMSIFLASTGYTIVRRCMTKEETTTNNQE
jgi:hypothetical protein